MNSGITSAIRPAIGPAIRSAFDGGYVPSLLSQAMAIVRKYGGALYNPSNLASLFQDSVGTIPVTAAGQPVGLMLDVSYGLQRGAELIVNGDFSAGSTGWSLFSGAAVASSGLSLPGASAFADSVGTVCTAGKWYQVEFDFLSGAGSQHINIYAGGPAFGVVVDTTPRRYKLIKLAVTNEAFRVQQDGGVSGSAVLDNISVKEVPGNHAFQATTTARPTYQLVDGYPAIVGDGVDDFLLSTQATPAGVTGSFAVSASKANALTRGVVMTSALLGTIAPGKLGEFSHEHFMYTINQPGGTVPGGMGNVDALDAVGAAGVRRVISGLYDWTSTTRESVQKVYVNGVLAPNGGAPTITASGTAAQTKLTLLASGAGQNHRFSGSLFMASYIPATPTTVEQAVIARFAASRSGLDGGFTPLLPTGVVYLIDTDGAYLTDEDGAYLIEG